MLTPGDPAPWFACRNSQGGQFDLSLSAGPYLVLCFYGSARIQKNRYCLEKICTEFKQYFEGQKFCFVGISIDPADEHLEFLRPTNPNIQFVWDFDKKLSFLYGAITETSFSSKTEIKYQPFSLILDPLLRVITSVTLQDDQHASELIAHLEKLPDLNQYSGVSMFPPALIIPRVFEPDFCQMLIDIHQKSTGYESGFMAEVNGEVVEIIDEKIKRRRDFAITVDEEESYSELKKMITERIQRRVLPEIYKAFQFKVTRMERFLIGCYEGEKKGFFRAHRDNFDAVTAHRRFACTINLNTEAYEGGALRFPEFGPQTYSVPTGAAIIFSCSLLHEALPVTKGQRFAFLPFFYNEAK
jgi:peroxiredoxin